MVNLPRPSAFASSSGIEVLPRAGPSLTVPDSPTSSCCYSFGLTTLPDNAEAIQDNELRQTLEQLFELSQLLAVPSPFGRGDGQAWTHSEHYPALLKWKQQHVPGLLSRVGQLLEQLNAINGSKDVGKDTSAFVDLVLGHVVCAVARHLPPDPVGLVPASKPSSYTLEASQDDGWTGETAGLEAQNTLDGSLQSTSSWKRPNATSLAQALLMDYIKPIFTEVAASSSASMSSVDPATGRKKAPAAGSAFISHLDANLGQHRFQSAAEDNDASNLAPRRFTLPLSTESLHSAVAGSTEGQQELLRSLTERNEALGCSNVLSWCLDNVQLRTESDWSSVWPLLVPPLLTHLEQPQPRFRLRGSMLVHKLLLRPTLGGEANSPHDIRSREVVLGKILVRTGIGSLLERALHANLTYIHDEQYAPGLLLHSIGALRQLILLTTYPIAWRDLSQPLFESPSSAGAAPAGLGTTALDHPDDCGKRRTEALFRLVSEAILSTWSYLPLPPSSTRLGRELVNVTCSAYLVLADDLAAPVLSQDAVRSSSSGEKGARKEGVALGDMARFFDVTLDWIFRSWMANVAFDHTEQITTTVRVLDVASRLLFPSQSGKSSSEKTVKEEERDSDADVCPSSGSYIGFILLSVAKCWISALESPLRNSTVRTEASAEARWKELQRGLAQLISNLSLADSSVEPRWAELVKVDQRLAKLSPPQ